MRTQKIEIDKIKPNPSNPRIIKDEKFKKLVASIREFPEMLEIRPIVVNADMIVLGGNMRIRACKEAGMKEVPVIQADQLTPEQQREFIIKDNVGFGEWDWEILANEWDDLKLDEWGIDIPIYADVDYSDKNEEVDLDDIQDEMVLQLHYTAEEYAKVKEGLSRIAATPEQAIFILLGYDKEI